MNHFWVVAIDNYDYDCGPELKVNDFPSMEAAIDYMAHHSGSMALFQGEHVDEDQWWGQMRKKQMEIALAGIEKSHQKVEEQERAELARLQAKYGATP